MARPVPERIDPWLLSEQEAVLEGRFALSALPRLAPLLQEESGEVRFVLRFGRDERGRSVIRSSVEAELQLQCQRCLGTLRHPVKAEADLALVRGPLEAEQLPRELDPLLMQEKELLVPATLVEDELLLSIPVAPRHAEAHCTEPGTGAAAQAPQAEPEARENPFAVLAALKGGARHS